VHVLDKLFDSIGSKDEDEVQPYEVRFDPETGNAIRD
jgi:cytochrome oxidase Cu insertion factor (SCO1/SenC/PrrC family)